MQRETEEGYIIITCDFTGEDWDGESPMIEGHQGSVVCAEALLMAVEQAEPATERTQCTMCLRHRDPPMKMWRHPAPPEKANPDAVICWECIKLADRTFAKDPDVEWEKRT